MEGRQERMKSPDEGRRRGGTLGGYEKFYSCLLAWKICAEGEKSKKSN